MTPNEKLSAQVIGELEQENERLRRSNNHLLALLETALDRLEARKINVRGDELSRKIAANAAEVASKNQRLRKLNAEMLGLLEKLYVYAAAAEISVSVPWGCAGRNPQGRRNEEVTK